MLFSYQKLKLEYPNIQNLSSKIITETKNGNLIRLKRDLYTNDRNEDLFMVSNFLYRPSYVSFYSALAYYDMIPERVYLTMSATSLKNRTKTYENKLGQFQYNDIPVKAYPFGITETRLGAKIASKEKALCDTLYMTVQVRSILSMKQLLFEDLRIDEDIFFALDFNFLKEILPLYGCTNTNTLLKYINRDLDNL